MAKYTIYLYVDEGNIGLEDGSSHALLRTRICLVIFHTLKIHILLHNVNWKKNVSQGEKGVRGHSPILMSFLFLSVFFFFFFTNFLYNSVFSLGISETTN